MGVLNVTPDSFSDGGRFMDPGRAQAQAEALALTGADIIDIGGESTRPGAAEVPVAEEWQRLAPVLERLVAAKLPVKLSVDTRKPELMERAAELGVDYVNDVGGGADDATLARLAAFPRLSYIAMHMHGTPATMQEAPLTSAAAVDTVDRFMHGASDRLQAAGFAPERIWLDPGFGFGKTDAANVALMGALPRWTSFQLAVGVSRKGLIGRTLGIPTPAERDAPSKMLELGLALLGARMVRTHDVARLKPLLALLGGDA